MASNVSGSIAAPALPERSCKTIVRPLASRRHFAPASRSRSAGVISAWLSFLALGLQPRQQTRDLADGGAHGRQHVALELRVVSVDLGIGQKHGELSGNVLDVVDDKGETLAVFAQLPGLRQTCMARCSATRLAISRPTTRSRSYASRSSLNCARDRARTTKPIRAAEMIERQYDPGARQFRQPGCRLRMPVQPDDPFPVAEQGDQGMAGGHRRGDRRHVP